MNFLAELAREAVENYIEKGKIIPVPRDFPVEFQKKKAGVFVTIEKHGELRGCIGTYLPAKESVAEEIISNSVLAATEDDRFGPIAPEELPHLSYTVYVLSRPERVTSTQQLDPRKFGAIVMASAKCGLLLPDLEGVETVEQQLNICCQKGGIDPMKEKIAIFRFAAQKHAQP
ncbi:MAG: AmmeMemoRadiSam system protein A [Candidatus Nealsonbacteria bacterium]|nr:AmmeMemoRadiSam system protein A [Candidatus Nealsonbacteria bacterium]